MDIICKYCDQTFNTISNLENHIIGFNEIDQMNCKGAKIKFEQQQQNKIPYKENDIKDEMISKPNNYFLKEHDYAKCWDLNEIHLFIVK